jgi:hypothetical protein
MIKVKLANKNNLLKINQIKKEKDLIQKKKQLKKHKNQDTKRKIKELKDQMIFK